MHPFTVAAYKLGHGKQLDSQFNNIFIQKRNEREVTVSYLNKEQECFKQLSSELSEYKSIQNYHLKDLIDGKECDSKRISVVRFDERPFYPRMKVDAKKNMYFEIVDKKEKVVNTFAIHEMINGNRNELDDFCESTDIYVKKGQADWKF